MASHWHRNDKLRGIFTHAREALIKSGLLKLPIKMSEFKAKIASNSTAIAQIFNAEIVYFDCSIANHGLFSASLGYHPAFSIAEIL